MTLGGYGTAAYMSPEQCSGDAITLKSDIYALGVMWYEMLSGKRLFDHENPLQLMQVQKESDPSDLINSNVPEDYQAIIK